ncbi:MAG: MATE family efflux transporter [Phycisphaerales bacterium]|nr:MATE family efflux transporter [Phycisphaerales bacterium]
MAGVPTPSLDGVAVKSPTLEMLRIAAPTILTMVSYTLMQFVDRYYCAQLGAEALSAASNGGLAAWIPASVAVGVVGVVNTYVSQNLGAGRAERGSAYAWNGLWLGAAFWAVVLVPYAVMFPQVIGGLRWLLGQPAPAPAVTGGESVYARIVLGGMVFTLWARAIAQYFIGMHRPAVVTCAAIAGNLVNWYLTWALVFGRHHLPEMGIAGSAVGTVIGTMVEFAVPMAVFISRKWHARHGSRGAWRLSGERCRDIWRIGWPAGLMFGNEMLCWGIFMLGFVAGFGAAHNAAGAGVVQYMHLSFMPAVGMSMAVTAVVGKCIGAGRHDLAQSRAWLGMRLAMGYMLLCAAGFLLFRHPMMEIFARGEADPALHAQIVAIGSKLLILAAVFQLFDAMGITLVGALRGAGDTVWPGVMTVFLSWGVIVGGGWLMTRLRPDWESTGPWLAAAAYIILFGIGLAYRWSSGRWKQIRLLERGGVAALGETEVEVLAGPGTIPGAAAAMIPGEASGALAGVPEAGQPEAGGVVEPAGRGS